MVCAVVCAVFVATLTTVVGLVLGMHLDAIRIASSIVAAGFVVTYLHDKNKNR